MRVLIYKEDDEWLAHILEMDLLAPGETIDEAISAVIEAVSIQVDHCRKHGLSPIFPAPKEYFDTWNDAQACEIKAIMVGSVDVKPDQKPVARTLNFNPAAFNSDRNQGSLQLV